MRNRIYLVLILIVVICILIVYYLHQPRRIILTPVTPIIRIPIIRIPIEDRVDLVMEDAHNVHNQTIRRIVVLAIKRLQESDRQIQNIDSTFRSIEQWIECNQHTLKPEVINAAKYVLHHIRQSNIMYPVVKITESEIIRLVWDRINHPINQTLSSNLIENLIQQLADCQSGEHELHCLEGRIVRIIQTLEQVDTAHLVDLKPLWAFKEEIVAKITQYRDKLMHLVPPIYHRLDRVQKLTVKDRRRLHQFNRCLITNLNRRFKKDYIQPGYLTQHELNDLTKVYYQSLYDF